MVWDHYCLYSCESCIPTLLKLSAYPALGILVCSLRLRETQT